MWLTFNPRRWSPLVVLLLGVALPFAPHVLLGTLPYEDDLANYFVPVMQHVAASLRSGHLPLWTSDLYSGFPLFADSEAGTLFLLNWLLVIFNSPTGFLALLFFSIALSALTLYGFARHLKLDATASIVASLVYALGGFATGHLVHISILNALITLPLVLLAVDRALLTHGRRQFAWLLAAGGAHALQWLAGHVQPPILTALLVGAYLPFRLWLCPLVDAPQRTHAQRFMLVVAAPLVIGVCAVGLAAAQWLPTLELARTAARSASENYAYATSYSLPPFNLITLLMPYFFEDVYGGMHWGLWPDWETTIYVGVLPLILASVAVCARPVRRNRQAIFWLAVALASVWLALADAAPLNLHQTIFMLPALNLLRAPARFVLLTDLALAMLAADGAHWLLTCVRDADVKRARMLARSVVLAIALFGSALFVFAGWIGAHRAETMQWLDEHYRALPNSNLLPLSARIFESLQWAVWLGNPRVLIALLLLLASALWLALTPNRRISLRLARVLLLLIVSVDLGLFAATFWRAVPQAALDIPDDLTRQLLARGGDERVLSFPQSPTEPNRLLRWHVPDASGYSSFESQRAAQLLAAQFSASNPLLDLAHVGWLVLPPRSRASVVANETDDVDTSRPLLYIATNTPPAQRTFRVNASEALGNIRSVSALEHAPSVEQGALVARIALRDANGAESIVPLRAGVETAEWALERDDVKAIARHQPAPIAFRVATHDDFSAAYPRLFYSMTVDLRDAPMRISEARVEVLISGVNLLVYRVQLTAEGSSLELTRFDVSNFETVRDDAQARVIRNRTVLPRAWLVPQARVEPNANRLWAHMQAPQFDPRQVVWLEVLPRNLPSAQPAVTIGSVKVEQLSDERLRLQVNAAADAFVVLSDSWYEGWQATDNGVPTPTYRADYLYRAIVVRAGQHEIEMWFDPQSVRWGFAVSAVTLLSVLTFWSWSWQRARRKV